MDGSVRKLLIDEGGSTAIEYALIAFLLSVVCIAAVSVLGGSLVWTYSSVRDEIYNVRNP